MNNLIAADFFRVRCGATLRNTFLGVVAVILLVLIIVEANTGSLVINMDMPASEIAALQQDLADMAAETPDAPDGAGFGLEMLRQFFVPFFFLPITIAVFCADFTAGTYRNTLSYESNRTRVYLAKLLLSVGLCLAMVLGSVVVSWLLGGIAFGFTGFTAAYFMQILTVLLLQLPIYLAFVAVYHCITAFTMKSSTTIAVFLVGVFGLTVAIQALVMAEPSLNWLTMLEPQSAGKMMAMYDTVPLGNIVTIAAYNIGITVAATLLGILRFRKTDMP